jgi:hypothetical protein
MKSSPSLVYELRQYTLVPGTRAAFTELFERELLESQEAVGMRVVGQFHDMDRPDVFVWVRAFSDMASRHESLEAFYGGSVWAAHRSAANAMLVDNDDVLLLAPSDADTRLVDRMAIRATKDETPAEAAMWEVVVYSLDGSGAANFSQQFGHQISTELTASGADSVAAFITEDSPNTFTRLPVRENEQVFVTVARYSNGQEHRTDKLVAQDHFSVENRATAPQSVVSRQRLRLWPSTRSALR